MPEDYKSEHIRNMAAMVEDELELIDLLRVIWKWKYMILAVTLVCTIVAGYLSFKKPPAYRLSTILEINRIEYVNNSIESENSGDVLDHMQPYIEPPAKIKALIEFGVFDDDLKKYLKKVKNFDISSISKFSVTALDKGNLLRVTYNTPDAGSGVNILNSLKPVVLKKYENKILPLLNPIIQKKINDIAALKGRVKVLKTDIANTSMRTKELESDIKALNRNTDSMNRQRDGNIGQGQSNSVTAALLHSTLIQQNLSLTNAYKNDYIRFLSVIENNKLELKRLEIQIQNQLKKLAEIESYQTNFEFIKVVKSPEKNIQSIKDSGKLSILIGAITGVSIALFLAFFLDYIFKAIKQRNS